MVRTKFPELTVKGLGALQHPEVGHREVRDGKQTGLVLRLYAGGLKIWYCVYRLRSVAYPQRVRLGEYGPTAPQVSLAEARERAENIRRGARAGIDPLARPVLASCPTLSELIDEYDARHLVHCRSQAEIHRTLKVQVGEVWGDRRADALTRREVRARLEEVARKTPGAANAMLEHLRAMFNWAVRQDILEHSPCVGLDRPAPKVRKQRVLSPAEIRALWKFLAETGGLVGVGLRLVLATAQRPGEIVKMDWSEIDLSEGWWTIPAEKAKNGLAHRVALSELVYDLLEEVRLWDGETHVLVGRWGRCPHMSPQTMSHALRSSWRAALKKLEIAPFTAHDLRRTAATQMRAAGVSRDTVSRILNHAEGGVTSIYDRHSYDPEKRRSAMLWDGRLRDILAGRTGVVEPMPVRGGASGA